MLFRYLPPCLLILIISTGLQLPSAFSLPPHHAPPIAQDEPGHLQHLTEICLIGLAPIMVLGFLMSWARLWLLKRMALRRIRCVPHAVEKVPPKQVVVQGWGGMPHCSGV